MNLSVKEIAEIEAVARIADKLQGTICTDSYDGHLRCREIASRLRALLPREESLEEAAENAIQQWVRSYNMIDAIARLRSALERRRKEQGE